MKCMVRLYQDIVEFSNCLLLLLKKLEVTIQTSDMCG